VQQHCRGKTDVFAEKGTSVNHSVTTSAINRTRTGLEPNPSLRRECPATDRLSRRCVVEFNTLDRRPLAFIFTGITENA